MTNSATNTPTASGARKVSDSLSLAGLCVVLVMTNLWFFLTVLPYAH